MSGRSVRTFLLLTFLAAVNLVRDWANHHSFSAALSEDWYWFALAVAITAYSVWWDRHPEIEARMRAKKEAKRAARANR